MRVGFAGTHRAGKTTLIERLADLLPGYRAFEEPYAELEETGYELSDPPTREDYEVQLRRSCEILHHGAHDALFDRTPLDFVGYLRAIGEQVDDDDVAAVRDAMTSLDLVVLVAIEEPDRITPAASEDRRLRRGADEAIVALCLDDSLELGLDVLEVRGDPDARAAQVLRRLRRA